MKITVGDLLDRTATNYPDTEALVYADRDLRYTYAQFREKCNIVAKGLLRLGIKKGDHVAIWATNIPEWVILQFATGKIGAILVTVNTSYKAHELEYILKQSDATTLFLIDRFRDYDYIETINMVIPELKDSEPGRLSCSKIPYLKNVLYMGEGRPDGMFNFSVLEDLGKDVTDEELAIVQSSCDPNETINMQYTSGTTGFPKGVMLTHFNIVNNAYNVGACMDLKEGQERMCIPVPFFHCFGCVLSTLNCVCYAVTMIPIVTFNPKEVLEAVSKAQCTILVGVPTMFIMELNHPDFAKYDVSSLRTGIMAGAPCPLEVMKQVMDKMNMTEITIAYGQTEASPVITQTRTKDPVKLRVETVGRALPDVDVKIVDTETGAEVPRSVQGELCTRGYLVMKGYYKMEDATANTIDAEGWLHTGDLATMDEAGYCKITGRIKNMIIRGGENIFPREIEEFYYTHDKVKDVQVFGVPDVKYGEQVACAIITAEGQELTEGELREYSMDRIARHKIPKYFFFLEEYPMTASGKVQKFKLREWAIKEQDLKDAANVRTA